MNPLEERNEHGHHVFASFFSIGVERQSVARHSVPPEKVAEPRKDIFYSFPSSLESRLIRLSAAFGTESKSFSTEAAKSPFPMKHFQRFLLLWQWFMQNTTEAPTATKVAATTTTRRIVAETTAEATSTTATTTTRIAGTPTRITTTTTTAATPSRIAATMTILATTIST